MPLTTSPSFYYRQPRMENVEDVEKYVPGGYHPVDIGDVIDARKDFYKVVHKLGHGGFSTVWLVLSCREIPKYYALKILCADTSGNPELQVLQHIDKARPSGHPNVAMLRDSFRISGPNGDHQCLVFPVLGPSLYNPEVNASLSDSARHQVCRQIADALAFLHSCGICHGDLTPWNIVFELPNIQIMSVNQLYELLGPINAEKLTLANRSPTSHGPKQVIETPKLLGLDCSLLENIRIIDFGETFFTDTPPLSIGTPTGFFPPELCFGSLPSTQSDIWQLACIMYYIQSDKILFFPGFDIFEVLIGTIVGYLGPLPEKWRGRFDLDTYGYQSHGAKEAQRAHKKTEPAWWYQHGRSQKSICGCLAQEAPRLPILELEGYVQLLNSMMAYEPKGRLSAIDVVQQLRKLTS
ncbi:hypothetical protein S40293_09356 [Stachybotrys chartarum IBT 40293]|nr:hypothetical protein S40293_09356 [Stachybotrys chartarum IBT 40293]